MNRRDFFKRTAAAAVVAPVVPAVVPAAPAISSWDPYPEPVGAYSTIRFVGYHGLSIGGGGGGGFTSSATGLQSLESHDLAMANADKARGAHGKEEK